MVRLRAPKDLKLKVLAAFFAFLLWFFVVLQDKIQKELKLKVIFSNLPQNTVILRASPTTFKLEVIGPRSILRGLSGNPVVVQIDLSRYPPGTHIIKIPTENIDLPSGLRVLEVIPPEMEIELDSVITKWLKVKADLRGVPKEGYRLKKVYVRPYSVKVRGASKILKNLKVIYTLPIHLSEREKSFKTVVRLAVPEGVLEVVPEKVTVIVKLEGRE